MQCPYQKWVWPKGQPILVPCGKCVFCLSRKRNEWSFRIMQEYKHSLCGHFLTLTYNEEFLPVTGVEKSHLQMFMKRLRNYFTDSRYRLRYYAVGEYGSKTYRPHYHIILFNCTDIERVRDAWRCSDTLRPYGIVHVGKVNESTVRYVTKYVMMKSVYPDRCKEPFALMSRSFGIGLWYLSDAMAEWHRSGERRYILDCGDKLSLPKYYFEKIWPWPNVRQRISQKTKEQLEAAKIEEDSILISQGYNPDAIRLEARLQEEGRIMRKVIKSEKL